MIKSWKHKGLQRFFETGSKAGIQPSHADRLREQLLALDMAEHPLQMNLPGYRLHRLSGDRQNIWSITVSGGWRITFEFIDKDAHIVNYEDYH